jgi:hypothetical protein
VSGTRLHSALSTSRRASHLSERPSLKLASTAGLSKLSRAITRSGTRRSFEHAAPPPFPNTSSRDT